MLWVRRSDDLSFAPGFHAFPGGKVHDTDAQAPSTGGSRLPFRVAALRELFEETGLLAVDPGPVSPAAALELREAYWRDACLGAARFAAAGLRWRTAGLEPIGRWVTPSQMPLRFDTQFFGLELDAPPVVSADGREVIEAELVTVESAMRRWLGGEVLIAPPVTSVLRACLGAGAFDAEAMRAAPAADGSESSCWEVVPSLQMLPLRTPTLPPATHTNAFFVGSGDAVLVEPASPDEAEIERTLAWVEENARRGRTLRAMILTHHHVDHAGGAALLKERLGVPLWGHARTADHLVGLVEVDRLLRDGERITLDGPDPIELVTVHTPGHASGHICLLEARSRVLIAGDMVASIGTILVQPPDGDMAMYLQSLRRIAALRPSMILPAHGAPIRDPRARIRDYIAHRLWREQKVVESLGRMGGGGTLDELVPLLYDDVDPSIWPLARGSAEAHLLKLIGEGRVERAGDAYRCSVRGAPGDSNA